MVSKQKIKINLEKLPGIGQSASLHCETTSLFPGHNSCSLSTPRLFGKTHSRVFNFFPPPQDVVHGVHSVHSVQTGQGSELQVRISLLSPSQVSSSDFGRTQSRIRCCVPPPQDKEHSVQFVHSVQTGQSLVLHSSVTRESPSQTEKKFHVNIQNNL